MPANQSTILNEFQASSQLINNIRINSSAFFEFAVNVRSGQCLYAAALGVGASRRYVSPAIAESKNLCGEVRPLAGLELDLSAYNRGAKAYNLSDEFPCGVHGGDIDDDDDNEDDGSEDDDDDDGDDDDDDSTGAATSLRRRRCGTALGGDSRSPAALLEALLLVAAVAAFSKQSNLLIFVTCLLFFAPLFATNAQDIIEGKLFFLFIYFFLP